MADKQAALAFIFGNQRSEISFGQLPVKIDLNNIAVMTAAPNLQASIGKANIHTHKFSQACRIAAALCKFIHASRTNNRLFNVIEKMFQKNRPKPNT